MDSELKRDPERMSEIFRFFKRWNNSQGVEECFKMIKRRFAIFCRTGDVSILSFEQMKHVLSDDTLTCSEDILLKALILWFYQSSKTQEIFNLFYKIRYSLISNKKQSYFKHDLQFDFPNYFPNSPSRYQLRCSPGSKIIFNHSGKFQIFSIQTLRCEHIPVKFNGSHLYLTSNSTSTSVMVHSKIYFATFGNEIPEENGILYVLDMSEESKQIKRCCLLPFRRKNFRMLAMEDYLYFCGGWYSDQESKTDFNNLKKIYKFCIHSHQWTELQPLHDYGYEQVIEIINGKIYFFCFVNRTLKLQIYDPNHRCWNIERVGYSRKSYHEIKNLFEKSFCSVTYEGKIYIFPSCRSSSDSQTMFEYDPLFNVLKLRYANFDYPNNILAHPHGIFMFKNNSATFYIPSQDRISNFDFTPQVRLTEKFSSYLYDPLDLD